MTLNIGNVELMGKISFKEHNVVISIYIYMTIK